jgi:uncharacterized protein YdaU (DUF1376 family)
MSRFPEDHISGYIDGQSLTNEEQRAVEQSLAESSALQAELYSLRHLKERLRQTAHTNAPESAHKAVHAALAEEIARVNGQSHTQIHGHSHPVRQPHHSAAHSEHLASPKVASPKAADRAALPNPSLSARGRRSFSAVTQIAAGLLALLVVVGVGYFALPKHSGTGNDAAQNGQKAPQPTLPNFRTAAMKNFDGVQGGAITLQCATSSFEELQRFFRAHGIAYTLIQPKLHATLLGGVVSEENGVKSAHLVYRADAAHKNALLYLWQIPERQYGSGAASEWRPASVSVDADVTQIIRRNGEWHWERASWRGAKNLAGSEAMATVAVWEDRATFCVMISELPQSEMMALML